MKLIFIRHGDPDYINDTLTPRGWEEAQALSKRVIKWNIDEIFCSPLGRAQDTASVFLRLSGRNAETLAWLREFCAPIDDPFTGEKRRPWDLLPDFWTNQEDLYDKNNWHENKYMQTGDVSSEYKKVCEGIDAILAERGYIRDKGIYRTENGNKKTLVFFCHLAVQFVILSHLFGVSAPVMWQNFFVAPTSVTLLETEEREKGKVCFRCKMLGDVSHLHKEDIKPSDSGFFNEVYNDII